MYRTEENRKSAGYDNTGTLGAGGAAMVYGTLQLIEPAALDAVTAMVPEPDADGVPEIVPVELFIDNPAGNPVALYGHGPPANVATSGVMATLATKESGLVA